MCPKPTCTTLGLYFFTGSVSVEKIVAQAAAEHLTPVTLELGGKIRIIDETANLKLALKKNCLGKIYECGTNLHCPDYILIQKRHER
jgi:aldehyde dehydrogenase (NAD+)